MSLQSIANNLADDVQIMELQDGKEVYVTGGHVDLRTAILRGGGVGSTWKYAPTAVMHIWLIDLDDGGITFGCDKPSNERCIPVTAILEDLSLLTRTGYTYTFHPEKPN